MPATAPVWKANGTAVGGTGAINVAWPTHAVGDFALLLVNTSYQPVTTPSGWTLISEHGGGTPAGTVSAGLSVYWNRATTTSMPVAAVDDSGDHTLGVIVTFTGVDTGSSPIEAQTTDFKDTQTTTDSLPSVTTLGPNRLIAAILSTGQESVKSAWTMAGLASFTARAAGVTTTGRDGGIACATGVKAAAGATGTGSVTSSIAACSAALTLALRPANYEQTVSPTGIATAQAVGAPTIGGGTVFVTGTPPSAYIGLAYTFQPSASGGALGARTWSIASGALPAGLSLNTSTGAVTGTPSGAGTSSFTLRATDSGGSNFGQLATSITTTDFGVPDAIDVVLYTGDGAGTKTIATTVDLSGGGCVFVSRYGSGANSSFSANLLSADGSTIYSKPSDEAWETAPTVSGSSVFANGSFTLANAALNTSGATYIAYVLRKHPLVCDVVVTTGSGIGVTNRAVAHNLGSVPGIVAMNGLGGLMWITGHTKSQYSSWSYSSGYKAGNTNIWGTTDVTTTNFYVGGNYTNIASRLGVFLVMPAASPFFTTGEYNGDSVVPNTSLISPGWPVQTLFYGRSGDLWASFDETREGAKDFPGFDGRMYLPGNPVTENTDWITGTTTGLTINDLGLNVSTVIYGYIALRRYEAFPGAVVSPVGIASAQAMGSPTIVQTMSMVGEVGFDGEAVIGLPETFTLEAVAGTAPYTLTVVSGALPSGWSITAVDGDTFTIGGTPSAGSNKTYNFTLRLQDSAAVFVDYPRTVKVLRLDEMIYQGQHQPILSGIDRKPMAFPPDFYNHGGKLFLVAYSTTSAEVRTATHSFDKNVKIEAYTAETFSLFSDKDHSNDPNVSITQDGILSALLGDNIPDGYGLFFTAVRGRRKMLDVVAYNGFITGISPVRRTIPHALGVVPTLLQNGEFLTSSAFADPDDGISLFDNTLRSANDYSGTFPTSDNFFIQSNGYFSEYIYADQRAKFAQTLYADQGYGGLLRTGSYVGNGSTSGPSISLGFYPQLIVTFSTLSGGRPNQVGDMSVAFGGATQIATPLMQETYNPPYPTEISGPFYSVNGDTCTIVTANTSFNEAGRTYHYLALRGVAGPGPQVVGVDRASGRLTAFGSPAVIFSVTATVAPTGIASAQAFGSPTVLCGAVTVVPTGIASAQAFGGLTVLRGSVVIAPASIASSESIGSPAILSGSVTIQPTGIVSAEAFGAPLISVSGGGNQITIPAAIGSAEAFGSPTLLRGAVTIAPTGIASAQAFGSPIVLRGAVTVSPASIASAEAFGSPTLQPGAVSIVLTSIASGFAAGSPTVSAGGTSVVLTGIASSEAFGSPSLIQQQFLVPASIVSSEAFGVPSLQAGAVSVAVTGAPSVGAFGVPSVGANTATPVDGLASSEQFGAPTITTATYIAPVGIQSAQAFGLPTTAGASIVALDGIASSEAFGVPSVQQQQIVALAAIESDEAFGALSMLAGVRVALVDGILSDEQFGAVNITTSTVVHPNGIPSGETFGGITLVPGQAWLEVLSIGSEEAFGFIYIAGGARPQIPATATRPSAGGLQVLQPSDDATAQRGDDSALALRPSAKKRTAYRPNKDSS